MNKRGLGGIFSVLMQGIKVMKKYIVIILALAIISACSTPKPYYKTAKGKKKTKYYNEIQFGGKSASQMRKY